MTRTDPDQRDEKEAERLRDEVMQADAEHPAEAAPQA